MLRARRRRTLKALLLLLCILRATALESSPTPISLTQDQLFASGRAADEDQQLWQLFQPQSQQLKLQRAPQQQHQEQQQQPQLKWQLAADFGSDEGDDAGTGNENVLAALISAAFPPPSSAASFPRWPLDGEDNSWHSDNNNKNTNNNALYSTDKALLWRRLFAANDRPPDWRSVPSKREPLAVANYRSAATAPPPPRYPYARRDATLAERPYKREKTRRASRPEINVVKLLPLLTADALKRPHHYFRGLQQNLGLGEDALDDTQQRLLNGENPLRLLAKHALELGPEEAEEVTNFLQALRSYEPSEKVRSLVAQTPKGYRGTHLIDPNYMWIGLGK